MEALSVSVSGTPASTSSSRWCTAVPIGTTPASRYRQWMTHKLASWYDQFDTSACVGCGRCITWYPVGIDITAKAAAFHF